MMITDLSDDLIEEILSRVPALHLGRSRYTCKHWNALVENPNFIKKHLIGKATKHSLVITLMDSTVYSMSLFETPRPDLTLIEFTRKLSLIDPHHSTRKIPIYKVFHCDGLFVCTTTDDKPVVWNPCTGQTMWLKPREPFITSSYSLGYTCDHKYKILRETLSKFIDIKEIYEFSSNTWRVLDDNFGKSYFKRNCPGVSLKGNTYWVAVSIEEQGDVLLSFDFSTERFGCLPFAFRNDLYRYDNDDISLAVVREEQLAVLHWKIDTYDLDIWVSKEIETTNVSWSFFLKVGLKGIPRIRDSSCARFFVYRDMNFVVCCYKSSKFTRNFVYLIGKEEAKFREISLDAYTEDILKCPVTLNYVPSLVRF